MPSNIANVDVSLLPIKKVSLFFCPESKAMLIISDVWQSQESPEQRKSNIA